ncbi:hypothetical protein, partial [Lactococcus garvieae]
MSLGAFSVSLAVKDIHKSKEFYENVGFEIFGGDINQHWLIMSNNETKIGLFQGMFEDNLLTFNPGWNNNAEEIDNFEDIRLLQQKFENNKII